MPQTNLEKKASYYERIIAEGKKSPHSQKYVAVCTTLKNLVALSKRLNKEDIKISPKAFEELNKNYNEVQNACRAYLEAENEFSPFEKSRKSIIKDISHVLSKDIAVLEKCDPMEPGSLSEIIDKSRSYTIVLKGNDIKTMGGAMSSRIPLKTPSGRKGFFTPKAVYNQDKKWAERIDKHIDRLAAISPKCKTVLEELKTDEATKDFFCNACPGKPIEEFRKQVKNDAMVEKRILAIASMIELAEDRNEAKKMLKDESVRQALTDFIDDVAVMSNTHAVMKNAGIKKDSNISSRNCAMTDVANLLGCGKLLATSVPMKIVVDGKEMEGVFMETADGTDLKRLKENDPILNADFHSFESSDGLNQIADLQVIDFICGNIDRHTGNMMYQFTDNKGNIKFAGIKGIDNDCSFGTVEIIKGKQVQQLVNPERMQFITASMCSKLQNITKDTFDLILAPHGLSEQEIDAAWDRVERVKTAIKEKQVEIIPDDYWKDHSLFKTETNKGNYFNKIKTIAQNCELSWYKDDPKVQTDIQYMQDRRTVNKVLLEKGNSIVALREKMDNAKALIFSTSEYKLMKNSFEKIERLTEEIRNDYKDPKDIPQVKSAELEKAYEELAEKSFKYISLKKLVPSTERGQKRIELAQDLLNFANDTLDEMTLNPEMEAQVSKEQPMEIDEPDNNIEL